MNPDRINAIMVLAGGLLAFAAVALPIVRPMLKRTLTKPVRDMAKEIFIPVLTILFLVTGFIFYYVGFRGAGICFVFGYAILNVVCFLRSKEPLTRSDIVQAVAPWVLLLYWAMCYLVFWNSDRISALESKARPAVSRE